MTVYQMRQEISHICDGPITSFVLISRAMEMVRMGADSETAANALAEELEARGMLTEGTVEVPGS